MATAPTNPIVKVAELDTILPSTQNVNKYPPDNQLATVGWDKGQFVSGEHLNYCFDNLSKWMTYLSERVGELQQESEDLKEQIERERVSVGEIIEITDDNRNPSVIKGYGTWESFGAGKVLVGVGSHTDDRGETKVWIDGHYEGEYKHVQTQAELAEHGHTVSGNTSSDGAASLTIPTATQAGEVGHAAGSLPAGATSVTATAPYSGISKVPTHTHTVTGTAYDIGSSSPMNITQPSLAVYRWKRTA